MVISVKCIRKCRLYSFLNILCSHVIHLVLAVHHLLHLLLAPLLVYLLLLVLGNCWIISTHLKLVIICTSYACCWHELVRERSESADFV